MFKELYVMPGSARVLEGGGAVCRSVQSISAAASMST